MPITDYVLVDGLLHGVPHAVTYGTGALFGLGAGLVARRTQ
jgi:hypothetical protein